MERIKEGRPGKDTEYTYANMMADDTAWKVSHEGMHRSAYFRTTRSSP